MIVVLCAANLQIGVLIYAWTYALSGQNSPFLIFLHKRDNM